MRRRNVTPATAKARGAAAPSVLSQVYASAKVFDMYPKVEAEHTRSTRSGGALSVVVGIAIALLLISETYEFTTPTTVDHVGVDTTTLGQRLQINLNVTFHALNCRQVDLVAMDVAGEHQLHVDHAMHKTRVDREGRAIGGKMLAHVQVAAAVGDDAHLKPGYCGACYGAKPAGKCCNTCDDIRDAYEVKRWDVRVVALTAEQCIRESKELLRAAKAGEGCQLEGHLEVNRVQGNFHVALGKTKSVQGRLLHTFNPADLMKYNTSHMIHTLSFGTAFGGQSNPLSGRARIPDPKKCRTGVAQYFIKVVPAMVHRRSRWRSASAVHSHQYSFTEKWNRVGAGSEGAEHRAYGTDRPILPGVFWMYDLSPFVVHRTTEPSATLLRYVTRLCAVIGGILSVTSVGHSLFERATLWRKQ